MRVEGFAYNMMEHPRSPQFWKTIRSMFSFPFSISVALLLLTLNIRQPCQLSPNLLHGITVSQSPPALLTSPTFLLLSFSGTSKQRQRLKEIVNLYIFFSLLSLWKMSVYGHSGLNGGPTKIHIHLEPQTVTLFGIRVLADVIKVRISRWNHPGWWWALNPMTGAPGRVRKGKEHKERHREGHV